MHNMDNTVFLPSDHGTFNSLIYIPLPPHISIDVIDKNIHKKILKKVHVNTFFVAILTFCLRICENTNVSYWFCCVFHNILRSLQKLIIYRCFILRKQNCYVA